jgi:CCR4-NOT transcription complex subunit 2
MSKGVSATANSSAPSAMSASTSVPATRRYSPAGDSFGLLGLQPVVTQQSDTPDAANMLQLTRGFDLSQLSLQVVQAEPLFPSMHSLWMDAPFAVQPEFKLPQCYTVSSPKLSFQIFQKFQVETLFYVYYSMPRDVLQVAAAQELHNRDWRYHKKLHLWLTRIPNKVSFVKTVTYEKGTFKFFNPESWSFEDKEDFHLDFEDLEEVKPATGGAGAGTGGSRPAESNPAAAAAAAAVAAVAPQQR